MIKNKMSSNNVIGSLSKANGEFEWLINLSDEILETKRYLESPTFSFLHGSWYCQMYPKRSAAAEYIGLYLTKKDIQSEMNVKFSLEMALNGMHLKKLGCEQQIFSKDAPSWGLSKFVLRSDVLDQWSKNPEDCSQLSIEIRMSDPVTPKDTLRERKKEGIKILCQNYRDLLLHDDGHDLILKVKDREFKAHRCIMRFRCPVFKAMLEHDMLEKSSGVVEIPDCEPLAFEQFLNYVYNGDLETLDESFMLGLYYIADKYDIACLKEMCCEFIKKSLSPSNVCDVIKLALNHSDSTLLECGKKYLLENVKKVLVTVGWQSFVKENFIQANELFIKIVDHYETMQKHTSDMFKTIKRSLISYQNV